MFNELATFNGMQVFVEREHDDDLLIGACDYHEPHAAFEAFTRTIGARPIGSVIVKVRLVAGQRHIAEKPVSVATAAELLGVSEDAIVHVMRTARPVSLVSA